MSKGTEVKQLCAKARKLIDDILPETKIRRDKVKTLKERSMGGEDFSYYLQRIPAAMFRLGVSSRKAHSASLHSAQFEFNDEAIRTGIIMMTSVVFHFLNRQSVFDTRNRPLHETSRLNEADARPINNSV